MNVKGFITPTASVAHPWNGLTLSDILGDENQHQTHMETPCIGQGQGLHCPCLVKKDIEIQAGFEPGSSEFWSDALTKELLELWHWSRR